MQSLHCILVLLSAAVIAAEVDDPNWDLMSNALQSNNFDQGTGFDIFQPSDTSNVDLNVGFWDDGSNPMLFSNLPNDPCFSAPLGGNARRRRTDQGLCGGESSDLSIPSVEELAVPGEFDKRNCIRGGFSSAVAFLVCCSHFGSGPQQIALYHFQLTYSYRGRQTRGGFFLLSQLPEDSDVACQRCSLVSLSVDTLYSAH